MASTPGEVTALLKRMKEGDKEVPAKLIPLVIGELRHLARHYMRNERVRHTLQPTALVNEAYMRLAGYKKMDWQSRLHFIGVAASGMSKVLTGYARRKDQRLTPSHVVETAAATHAATSPPPTTASVVPINDSTEASPILGIRRAHFPILSCPIWVRGSYPKHLSDQWLCPDVPMSGENYDKTGCHRWQHRGPVIKFSDAESSARPICHSSRSRGMRGRVARM